MASKKTYKFTHKQSGAEIKISFYSTGIYTYTDPKGYEHEEGEWIKHPELKANGKPSKTTAYFSARPFSGARIQDRAYQRDIAHTLAIDSYYRHNKN